MQTVMTKLFCSPPTENFSQLAVINCRVAAVTASEKARLADALDTPTAELEAVFASESAAHWTARLAEAGVGCVRADGAPPSEFWLDDPQVDALALTAEVEHARWGSYRRHGAMVLVDGEQPPLAGAPLGGQHNGEVLGALGYDAEAIAALQQAGVIWQEDP